MPHRLSHLLLILIVLAGGAIAGASHAAETDEEQAFVRTNGPQLAWGACPDFMPKSCELAVVQGDAAEPNADIFFKVPGGTELPRHWHRSPERIVMLTGTMKVDYDGQEPVELEPGTYGYGPAELPHSAVCTSDEACVLFIAFENPVDAMPK